MIRCFLTDLGIVTMPHCKSQRRMIWATDLLYFAQALLMWVLLAFCRGQAVTMLLIEYDVLRNS